MITALNCDENGVFDELKFYKEGVSAGKDNSSVDSRD